MRLGHGDCNEDKPERTFLYLQAWSHIELTYLP